MQAGYVGEDVESILYKLLAVNNLQQLLVLDNIVMWFFLRQPKHDPCYCIQYLSVFFLLLNKKCKLI